MMHGELFLFATTPSLCVTLRDWIEHRGPRRPLRVQKILFSLFAENLAESNDLRGPHDLHD